MVEQGLAQQQAMQQQQMVKSQGQAPEGQPSHDMIMHIATLLQQGMTPEELLQKGVPPEVIEMAMGMLTEQKQIPQEQAGLAGMYTSNQQQGLI